MGGIIYDYREIIRQIELTAWENFADWRAMVDGEEVLCCELEFLCDKLHRTPGQIMLQKYLKLLEEKLNREQLEQSSPGIVAWEDDQ